jgi:hypothetical protein
MAKLEAEQKATEEAAATIAKPSVDVASPVTTTTTPPTPTTETKAEPPATPTGGGGTGCNNYEAHKFKKDTCARCFKAKSEHTIAAPAASGPAKVGGGKACGKYVAHKFKKDTCATCFQLKSAH